MAEAISYGDRQTSKYNVFLNWFKSSQYPIMFVQTVSSLLNKLKAQAREQMEGRRPNLVQALKKMGDFYMELKWDFQSWGKNRISYNA